MRVCDDKRTWHSDQLHSLDLLVGEKKSKGRLIRVLTPITNTSRELFPRIKHGTDNHKSRRDGTFTNSENKTNDKETGKVFASRMTT